MKTTATGVFVHVKDIGGTFYHSSLQKC